MIYLMNTDTLNLKKHFSVCEFKGIKLAITICEDLWDEQPFDNGIRKDKTLHLSPMEELARQKPGYNN